jgi:hypothetical protein
MRILRLLAVVGALAVSLTTSPLHATCGDAVVDPDEHCDHGAANGADGCCTAECLLVDADFDALCDAFDGCDNFAVGARIKEPRLEVRGLATSPGDDVLRFSGRVTLPATPAIDPAVQGMRISLSDSPGTGFAEGTRVLDARLPGGARWVRRGERWTYRDRSGSAGGITRVGLRMRAPIVPTTRLVDAVFVLEGRGGSYPLTPEMATIVWDDATGTYVGRALVAQVAFVAPGTPTNPQCGSVYFTSPLPTTCAFSAGGASCEGLPIGGPCRIGDPDDLAVCDIVNAIRGQERFQARHGFYFSGACATLPGVVKSPGVTCVTFGDSLRFDLHASHPWASRFCTWTSTPAAGTQPLTCS